MCSKDMINVALSPDDDDDPFPMTLLGFFNNERMLIFHPPCINIPSHLFSRRVHSVTIFIFSARNIRIS